MADAEFTIGRGRIYPVLRTQLSGPGRDTDGRPLIPDYSGWTVKFRLYQNGVQIFERDAEWEDAASAVPRYRWTVADTDRTPGRYEGKMLTFDPSGNPGPVYPVTRYTSIRIDAV